MAASEWQWGSTNKCGMLMGPAAVKGFPVLDRRFVGVRTLARVPRAADRFLMRRGGHGMTVRDAWGSMTDD